MTVRRNINLARSLRQQPNRPEEAARQTLRQLKKEGLPVRRQFPIGPHVAAFASTRASLVIEIDGGIHDRQDVAANDLHRQNVLEGDGWHVPRVDTQTALSPDHLIQAVRSAARGLPFTPDPSFARGEGDHKHP